MRTVEMPWRAEGGVVTLPSKQYMVTGRASSSATA